MEGHIPSLSKDVSEFLHPSRETPYLCQTIPERSVSEINTSKKLSDPRRCRLYSVRRRAVSLIASDSSCSVELTVIPPLSTLEVRSDDVHSRWSCQWSRSISRPVQSCGPDQPRDVPRRVHVRLTPFSLCGIQASVCTHCGATPDGVQKSYTTPHRAHRQGSHAGVVPSRETMGSSCSETGECSSKPGSVSRR
jgi:hypothetical protein